MFFKSIADKSECGVADPSTLIQYFKSLRSPLYPGTPRLTKNGISNVHGDINTLAFVTFDKPDKPVVADTNLYALLYFLWEAVTQVFSNERYQIQIALTMQLMAYIFSASSYC